MLAIFVIYVVLGILYESFIHPLTILSGLPSAGFGALLTLLMFKQDLDIYAFVGIIMLVGLVKKNGIMMIDFAIEPRQGTEISAADAIYEACLVRFRPIMMTTMAALHGHAADRARLGRRRRSAPAARPRRRRRPARVADAHALRDAGVLRLHGEHPGLAEAPQDACSRRCSTGASAAAK